MDVVVGKLTFARANFIPSALFCATFIVPFSHPPILQMAANGSTSPVLSSSPPLASKSPPLAIISDHRRSVDSERSAGTSPPPVLHNGVNGHTATNGGDNTDEQEDRVTKLQRELDRTRQEKEALAAQYQTLLARLTQMRTTLGNKLKQDAVCEDLNILSTRIDDGTTLGRT